MLSRPPPSRKGRATLHEWMGRCGGRNFPETSAQNVSLRSRLGSPEGRACGIRSYSFSIMIVVDYLCDNELVVLNNHDPCAVPRLHGD